MRSLVNIFLLALALLVVLGVYVFRTQLFSTLQSSKTALLGSQTAKQRTPQLRPPAAAKPRRGTTSKEIAAAVDSKPNAVVTVVEAKQSPDSIKVGMAEATLRQDFPPPSTVISSREGSQFVQTYIYLVSPHKAKVVRVVNDSVTSVQATKTIDPPLLVTHDSKFKVVSSANSKSPQ
jgi:hypothetical protein